MSVRVGINGFGRIGRNFFRAARKRAAPTSSSWPSTTSATPRRWRTCSSTTPCSAPLDEEVEAADGAIHVDGLELRLLNERDPAALPWRDLDVAVVLESTGLFTKREQAQKHLDAGAEKVVISAPATDPDVTIVLGVNDDAYDKEQHRIVSNASCTTNCVAPLAKVLHDAWGIESGFMTTIHAYTNDQQILDLPHKDLRRARARGHQPHPDLDRSRARDRRRHPRPAGQGGRHLDPGAGSRRLGRRPRRPPRERGRRRRGERRSSPRWRTTGALEGILRYSDDPLVSTDIIGSDYSSIFDSQLTMANGNEVKVFGWYDNEWGYSCRLVDIVERLL